MRRWQVHLCGASCSPSSLGRRERSLWEKYCLWGRGATFSMGVSTPLTPAGPAHGSRCRLTSLLDAGGWGGRHRLGCAPESVGGGPRRWARGQGSGRGPSQLPHPLFPFVFSPLPVYVLGIPGRTLQEQERGFQSAQGGCYIVTQTPNRTEQEGEVCGQLEETSSPSSNPLPQCTRTKPPNQHPEAQKRELPW